MALEAEWTAGFGGSLRVVTERATDQRRAEEAPAGGPRTVRLSGGSAKC